MRKEVWTMSNDVKHANNTPSIHRCWESAAIGLFLLAVLLGCAQDKGEQEVASGDPDNAPYAESAAPVDSAPAQAPVQRPAFTPEFVEPPVAPQPTAPQIEPNARFGYSEPSATAPVPQYAPRSLSPQAPSTSPNLQRSVAPRMSQYSQPQAMPLEMQQWK